MTGERRSRRWRSLATACCLVLFTCADPAEMPPTSPPSINGVITRVERSPGGNDAIARIVVEENPAEAAGSAKASVRLTTRTRILAGDGPASRPDPLDALVNGARVSVWFTGPVAESYPVQATADVVVVERGG